MCQRFGAKVDPQANRSLAEEAARRILTQIQTTNERDALPRYAEESWIALFQQLWLLRAPLAFDTLFGLGIYHVVESTTQEEVAVNTDQYYTAMSNHIMRGGRHYAEFTISGGNNMFIGVMRPIIHNGRINDEEVQCFSPFNTEFMEALGSSIGGRREETNNIHCCMYSSFYASCVWTDWESHAVAEHWEGREELIDDIDNTTAIVGMLLNLDEGTLSMYKDGAEIGVLKHGLAGEYCWAVSLRSVGTECKVKIKRGDLDSLDIIRIATL